MEAFEGKPQTNSARESLYHEQKTIPDKKSGRSILKGKQIVYTVLLLTAVVSTLAVIYLSDSGDFVLEGKIIEASTGNQSKIVIAGNFSALKVDTPLNLLNVMIDQAELIDSDGRLITTEQLKLEQLVRVHIYQKAPILADNPPLVDAYRIEIIE